MSKAQGQFTIIDYNDAITLTGYIGASQPKTQMFNPDNGGYTPDWSSANQVLTPSLFVAGSGSDVITGAAVQSVTWYDGSTAITDGTSYGLSGNKNHILTIKANVLASLPGKDYRCVVVYRDPTTNLDLSYTMSISLSRVVNGGGIVDLIVTTPGGNVFKNGAVTSLTARSPRCFMSSSLSPAARPAVRELTEESLIPILFGSFSLTNSAICSHWRSLSNSSCL